MLTEAFSLNKGTTLVASKYDSAGRAKIGI